MKQQITDELFNELYNYKYGHVQYMIDQILNKEVPPSLDEIATRCKIYAIKNGYEIWSGLTTDKSRECGYRPEANLHEIKVLKWFSVPSKKRKITEAQAVIETAEYVYKEKLSQRKNKKDKR